MRSVAGKAIRDVQDWLRAETEITVTRVKAAA
jgi:hypothetical protein